jgi:MFS family permease
VSGTWAARLPALKASAGLGNGELGIALVAMSAGLLVGTRLAAGPIDRAGTRRVVRVGTLALCAALILPALARSLLALSCAFLVLGAVSGLLDVAINTQGIEVQRAHGRSILSGLHGAWSLGGFAGAAAAVALAGAGLGPLAHFAIVAGILAAVGAWASGALLSGAPRVEPAGGRSHGPAPRGRWSPAIALLGVIAFASFLGEGSASDWSAVYLRGDLGASASLAAMGFAVFAGAMTITRFTADRMIERHGPVAVVRVGALVAACGMGLALIAQHPGLSLIGFACLGIGLAPVVPVAFAAAGAVGGLRPGGAISRVAMLGYVGSIAGPAAIGALAQAAGLRMGLALAAVLALVIAVAADAVAPADRARN